jgi:hypothetical protein
MFFITSKLCAHSYLEHLVSLENRFLLFEQYILVVLHGNGILHEISIFKMFTIINMTFNVILFTSTCKFYEDAHLRFSPRNYVLLSIIFSNIYLILMSPPIRHNMYIHAQQKLFFLSINSLSAKGSSF